MLAPKALLKIGYQGRWSLIFQAVIDTGSPATLVSSSVAEALGCDPEQIRAITPEPFEGVGAGNPFTARPFTLDLSFLRSSSTNPELGFLLRGALVYLCDVPGMPFVLIGQRDALERLRFEQRNYAPHRDFLLAHP